MSEEQGEPVQGPAEEQGEPNEQGGSKYKTKAVSAIPDNLKGAFESVVLAGIKVMSSEGAIPLIQQEMQSNKPMFQKLGESVAGLMGIIAQESKGKMSKDVMIPAALELIGEAADFITRSKLGQVGPDDVKKASQYLVILMLHGQGASQDQITQVMTGNQSQPQSQPQAQPQPQAAA